MPIERPNRRIRAPFAVAALLLTSLQCTHDSLDLPEPDPGFSIDGKKHCAVDPSLPRKWKEIALSAGEHTFRLENSNYGRTQGLENHTICVMLGALVDSVSRDDYFFTLNAIGEEKTVTLAEEGEVLLGFVNTLFAASEHGTSWVAIDTTEFVIPGRNYIVSFNDLYSEFHHVETDSFGPGLYTITLTDSDFSSEPGVINRTVCLTFDLIDTVSRDRWFLTLNGIDDQIGVRLEEPCLIYGGFLDLNLMDNEGGSEVEVEFLGE